MIGHDFFSDNSIFFLLKLLVENRHRKPEGSFLVAGVVLITEKMTAKNVLN